MNEQSITLDLRKTGFGKRVVIRQNDYHGTTLAVDVTDGSKAYSVPAAAKCCLMARMLGSYVRDGGCTVEDGRIVYTADERMFGASGTAEAYFRIEVDGAAYSTEGFQLVVERAADSYAQLSKAYDTKVDQAIRDAGAAAAKADDAAEGAKAAGGRADAAAKKADDAAAKAEAWAGKVDTAAASATTAAEKAEAAAQQATAAANKVFPAADNVLTGIASGAVAHADDAFEGGALRGIAVEGACRQDTTTGKNLFDVSRFDTTTAVPYGLSVSLDGSIICVKGIASGIGGIEAPSFTLGFYRDTSLSGRGLAIKAYGQPSAVKSVYGLRTAEETQLSITTSLRDGDDVDWRLRIAVSDGELAAYEPYSGGKPSPSPEWPQEIHVVERPTLKVAGSDISSPQTRAFALPAEHPYLAKLPDGTADAIEVDAEGNVELVARVGRAVPTKDNVLFYSDPNGAPYVNIRFATARRDPSLMCNSYVVSKWTNQSGFVYCPSTSGLIVRDSRFTSGDVALKLLEDTVIYVEVPETRYPLAPIDMPKAQDGIINAWTDAEVTPSTSIRYIRDINVVVANIESAIASIS